MAGTSGVGDLVGVATLKPYATLVIACRLGTVGTDRMSGFEADLHPRIVIGRITEPITHTGVIENTAGLPADRKHSRETRLSGLHLVRETTRDKAICRETVQGGNRWCIWAIDRLAEYA